MLVKSHDKYAADGEHAAQSNTTQVILHSRQHNHPIHLRFYKMVASMPYIGIQTQCKYHNINSNPDFVRGVTPKSSAISYKSIQSSECLGIHLPAVASFFRNCNTSDKNLTTGKQNKQKSNKQSKQTNKNEKPKTKKANIQAYVRFKVPKIPAKLILIIALP